MYSHYKNIFYWSFPANLYVLLPVLPSQPTDAETWAIVFSRRFCKTKVPCAVSRSMQSWKGHDNAFVSSGFPCYVVYSIENILSFSSGKLENRPFKMGSRKAGFHCTTVKCFAPDILVLNSGDVRCWVRGREGVMFGVWLNSIKVDSNDNLTQFGSSHSGKVRTLAYIS